MGFPNRHFWLILIRHPANCGLIDNILSCSASFHGFIHLNLSFCLDVKKTAGTWLSIKPSEIVRNNTGFVSVVPLPVLLAQLQVTTLAMFSSYIPLPAYWLRPTARS